MLTKLGAAMHAELILGIVGRTAGRARVVRKGNGRLWRGRAFIYRGLV